MFTMNKHISSFSSERSFMSGIYFAHSTVLISVFAVDKLLLLNVGLAAGDGFRQHHHHHRRPVAQILTNSFFTSE